MGWWQRVRSVLPGGRPTTRYWCDACRAWVPDPVTDVPPGEVFWVDGPLGVREATVRKACDACWRRHRELIPEGEAWFRRKHPVEKVCEGLRAPDLRARERAVYVLNRLGDPAAVEPLIRAIRLEMRHPTLEHDGLARSMMHTLAVLGDADAERFLVTLLHTPATWRPIHRPDFYPVIPATEQVLPALGARGDTVMLAALLDLLSASRPATLRRDAAQALSELARKSRTDWWPPRGGPIEMTDAGRRMFLDALSATTDDEDESVRTHAHQALRHARRW